MSTQGSSSPSVSSGSFDDYNSKLQALALRSTRNAASLPADINFYRSLDPGVADQVDTISSRVLNIANKLIDLSSSVDPKINHGKGKAKLETKDDVVDKFHTLVVDVMDHLFERTDSNLDQVLGRIKVPAITINPPVTPASQKRKVITSKSIPDQIIHHAAYLAKPQLSFKRRVDNSDAPWYPSLSHKYNAKVPLGHVYTSDDEDVSMDGNSSLVTNHPYRYEINHISYPSHVYNSASPTPPSSLSETPFTWIATSEALQGMLDKLRVAKEIAVDLEHHSYRSYSGFLCLMQISTREEDFVVDAVVLRDEMEVLNEVFTDPKTVKVFHGAESDIVWLQQDFNIYVVNLFDTFHASKLLEFPRHGLANLLEMYCDYLPDKRYQLADWRIRPLPDEMLEYARSDTHFLLFIYDNLRNALLDRAVSRSRSSSPPTTSANAPNSNSNAQALSTLPSTANASTNPAHALINHVLARSAETCLRVYTKEPYDHASGSGSTGWDTLAKKWNKPFLTASGSLPLTADFSENQILSMQKAVYRAIHWWRERVAREEDESTRYVLPNQYLFRIAEAPPGDLATLLRMFGNQVPAVVKKRAKELLDDIREAVSQGLGKTAESKVVVEVKRVEERPEMIEVQQASRESTGNLWGTEKPNQMIRDASSLFGNPQAEALTPSSKPRIYSSVQSTLFGNGKTANARHENSAKSTRFQELVTRINSTLIIAPIVPKVTSTVATSDPDITNATEVLDDTTGMQIEIPFVPASQRQNTAVVEERDTIVVVGKPKVKKRKRTKNTVEAEGKDPEDASEEIPHVSNAENDVKDKPFDFASVPNILDNNPDMEDRKPLKRQKKKGQGGQFLGDFPAPPKAHSEFKGGNKSHTFK